MPEHNSGWPANSVIFSQTLCKTLCQRSGPIASYWPYGVWRFARLPAPEAHFFCLGDQARGLADALLGKCNGVQRGAGNAPTLATPQKARFRGASGRLDSLGKGFPERGGSATKWYHSPAPLRGGPAGRSAGELLNKPEERDGLRDLPAGPGQPVQMPGMRGRALFALYEGAPEESLLAARTAAAGPLPLPGR